MYRMNQEMLSAVRDGTAANWNFEGKLRNYFLFTATGGGGEPNRIRRCLLWTAALATDVREMGHVGKCCYKTSLGGCCAQSAEFSHTASGLEWLGGVQLTEIVLADTFGWMGILLYLYLPVSFGEL